VVSAAVLGFAAPAYAHHSVLAGSTECFDGDHLVNWSIQAVSVVHLPMTIASASATIGGTTYPVTGYTPTIDDLETTYATTTVPAGTTGTITLHVHSTWPDGVTYDDHTSVELITDCNTTTTATTTTTPTTTTLPPTTTTIGEQGSTTTTQPPCTESTTTTLGEQGSTSVPVTVPETTGPTTTTQPMCNESTTTTEATTTTTFGEQGSTSVPVTVPETTSPTGPPTPPPTTGPPGAATTFVQQDTPTSAPGAVTGQLPRTGNNSGFPLALGAGCLAAGGLLALRRRKAWSR
jgi:LPXTG-motif cell wall-anchored protein